MIVERTYANEDRFFGRVDFFAADGCWRWLSPTNRGYGRFSYAKSKQAPAHRVAYEWFIGPIPEGLYLDHLCRNRSCVNPAHLEPVTCQENLLRGQTAASRNAAKTHCTHGHEFTRENTYWRPHGRRECRTCWKAMNDRASAKRKVAA